MIPGRRTFAVVRGVPSLDCRAEVAKSPATAVTDYPVARTDVCGPSGDVSVTVADIVAASGM